MNANTTTLITEFEVRYHGIGHEQYFQGCSVSFTQWDECYTGCGATASEALDDALEQMAYTGLEIPEHRLAQDIAELVAITRQLPSVDHHHYVSVLYKLPTTH